MSRLHFISCITIALCFLLFTATGYARNGTDEDYTPQIGQRGRDVLWIPTPQRLVDIMLDLAQVTSSDHVIDLGSGDGRIVIAAAQRGATALGIEYNPVLVEFSRRAAVEAGVADRATFKEADIFESDFSEASVITLYLLQSLNLRLKPTILDMEPGTRVVSNSFNMGNWEPDQRIGLAHFWIVPARVDGTWQLDDGQIHFIQEFQKITGTLTMGKEMELVGKLEGYKITFSAGGVEYTGTVSANTISGTRAGSEPWQAIRLEY